MIMVIIIIIYHHHYHHHHYHHHHYHYHYRWSCGGQEDRILSRLGVSLCPLDGVVEDRRFLNGVGKVSIGMSMSRACV